MDEDRLKQLEELQKRIGYTFRNPQLLETSLTHKSYINENPRSDAADNERMEFLGDAVLGLCISDLLMKKHVDLDEGDLSQIRALLVKEKPLADMATMLGLGEYLLLGRGEENSGGRQKESLLANAFEALIAAVYLDSTYSRARTFIRRLMTPMIEDKALPAQCEDFKTLLQELCHKKYKAPPVYTLLAESGPDHDKTFEVEVSAGDFIRRTGRGKSKKEAQKQAAQKAWEYLQHENDS